MNYTVTPGRYGGTVRVPASKSLMHRYLIISALSGHRCTIGNITLSDDVMATVRALECFGAAIEINEETITVDGSSMHLPEETVDCGESGSTLRFLIPLAALFDRPVSFTGAESLMKRPLSEYRELFERYELEKGVLTVQGFTGKREYEFAGDVSSQFFSGLMMTTPLLGRDTVIRSRGKLQSQDYVRMTAQVMKQFGAEVVFENDVITVRGNRAYQKLDVMAEGDWTQASYWLALGCINSPVKVTGLGERGHQGDASIAEIITGAGGKIRKEGSDYIAEPAVLSGCDLDGSGIPDLVMTLAVLAMYSKDKWIIRNIARLRYKESDRLNAIRHVFGRLGAIIETENDTIIISGRRPLQQPVTVDGFRDHRMIMAAAICATGLEYPVTITGSESVSKSYPDFFADLERLKIK